MQALTETYMPTAQDIYNAANDLDEATLKTYISHGPVLNYTNSQGQSPIFALAYESTRPDGSIDYDKFEAVRLLLKLGVDGRDAAEALQ